MGSLAELFLTEDIFVGSSHNSVDHFSPPMAVENGIPFPQARPRPRPRTAYADSQLDCKGQFEVLGSNRASRRHSTGFEHNPLHVQGRNKAVANARSTLSVPCVPQSPAIPVAPTTTTTNRSSKYTPSPLSRTSTLIAEEAEEDIDGSRHAKKRLSLAAEKGKPSRLSIIGIQSVLSRKKSTKSVKSPQSHSNPAQPRRSRSFIHVPNTQTHSFTRQHSHLSLDKLPDYSQQVPSTSRDPSENWMTAPVTPRFSRTNLPSVVMPIPANRRTRTQANSRSSSTTSLGSTLDGSRDDLHSLSHANPSERPSGYRSNASQSSLKSVWPVPELKINDLTVSPGSGSSPEITITFSPAASSDYQNAESKLDLLNKPALQNSHGQSHNAAPSTSRGEYMDGLGAAPKLKTHQKAQIRVGTVLKRMRKAFSSSHN
ncbi:hypothetical protein FRC02_010388 [Tulasnella sp. 418]|nr:hypothetical protein FRC02_010388 [Tulasnella sp. 418]